MQVEGRPEFVYCHSIIFTSLIYTAGISRQVVKTLQVNHLCSCRHFEADPPGVNKINKSIKIYSKLHVFFALSLNRVWYDLQLHYNIVYLGLVEGKAILLAQLSEYETTFI